MTFKEFKQQVENVAIAMVALVHPSTIDKFAVAQLRKQQAEEAFLREKARLKPQTENERAARTAETLEEVNALIQGLQGLERRAGSSFNFAVQFGQDGTTYITTNVPQGGDGLNLRAVIDETGYGMVTSSDGIVDLSKRNAGKKAVRQIERAAFSSGVL